GSPSTSFTSCAVGAAATASAPPASAGGRASRSWWRRSPDGVGGAPARRRLARSLTPRPTVPWTVHGRVEEGDGLRSFATTAPRGNGPAHRLRRPAGRGAGHRPRARMAHRHGGAHRPLVSRARLHGAGGGRVRSAHAGAGRP